MAALNFLITDFGKYKSKFRLSSAVNRGVGYYVVSGNIKNMKEANPYDDTIYGITNLIAEKYFKSRYMHVITMSLYDSKDTFLDIDITDLDVAMDILEQAYNEEIPVLCINLVARDIFKNNKVAYRAAEDACTMFRRYGFIDIGSQIHDFNIPTYVLLKANDTGTTAIIENEKSFW